MTAWRGRLRRAYQPITRRGWTAPSLQRSDRGSAPMWGRVNSPPRRNLSDIWLWPKLQQRRAAAVAPVVSTKEASSAQTQPVGRRSVVAADERVSLTGDVH